MIRAGIYFHAVAERSSRVLVTALSFLKRRSNLTITLSAVAMIVFIGVVDVKAGLEVHLHFFYVVPIALVSWFVTGTIGVYVAVLSNIVYFFADGMDDGSYSTAWIPYWNFLMRGGIFVVIALALSQLRARFDALTDLANRDFLTGLPNGRAFYELAAGEMERAYGLEPLTLACLDVEGFKWVNHRFGYATGDQMLCSIAQVIRESVARPDLIGRIGGTAFAVLLPNTTSERAAFVLENIQKKLKEERRRFAQPLNFFISAIACSRAPRSIAELMHEAELHMSRIKGGARDTIEIARVEAAAALN
jgi:diguanylate cyclase (GGDEF)-like protein